MFQRICKPAYLHKFNRLTYFQSMKIDLSMSIEDYFQKKNINFIKERSNNSTFYYTKKNTFVPSDLTPVFNEYHNKKYVSWISINNNNSYNNYIVSAQKQHTTKNFILFIIETIIAIFIMDTLVHFIFYYGNENDKQNRLYSLFTHDDASEELD